MENSITENYDKESQNTSRKTVFGNETNIKDAVRFSNFAQRVKIAYWEKLPDGYRVPEIYLDDILLLAWEDFNKE